MLYDSYEYERRERIRKQKAKKKREEERMRKKEERIEWLKGSRFMAMSKLIGVIVGIIVVIIVFYSLTEMHRQNDLSSLPQLIISVFAVAGVYVGFYLTMAKVEHVEKEITERQEKLKECGVTNEELIEAYKNQTDQLNDILGQLITREDSNNNF